MTKEKIMTAYEVAESWDHMMKRILDPLVRRTTLMVLARNHFEPKKWSKAAQQNLRLALWF